jgi:hypothetical protein
VRFGLPGALRGVIVSLVLRDSSTSLDPRLELSRLEADWSIGPAEAHTWDPPRLRRLVEPGARHAEHLDHLGRSEQIGVRTIHDVPPQAAEVAYQAIEIRTDDSAAATAVARKSPDEGLEHVRLVADDSKCPQRVRGRVSVLSGSNYLRANEIPEPHTRGRRSAQLAEREPGLVVNRDAGDARARRRRARYQLGRLFV